MFPDVFRNRIRFGTCFGRRGFECGDGWYALIAELAAALSPLDAYVTQIKNKFGRLRCYGCGPDVCWDICQEFEERSASICEECGAPARMTAFDGYYQPLCPACIDRVRKERGPASYDFADPESEIDRALRRHNQRAIRGFVEIHGLDFIKQRWDALAQLGQPQQLIQKVRGILGTIEKRAADKGKP